MLPASSFNPFPFIQKQDIYLLLGTVTVMGVSAISGLVLLSLFGYDKTYTTQPYKRITDWLAKIMTLSMLALGCETLYYAWKTVIGM